MWKEKKIQKKKNPKCGKIEDGKTKDGNKMWEKTKGTKKME